MRALGRELSWFALFGLAASAVHFIIALSAARWLGLAPLAANALAFCVALGVSFAGNARLTFGVEARLPAFVRFAALSLAAFGLNQAIVYVLTERLGWPFLGSLLVVLATVPAFTFAMAKSWALVRRP